MNAGTHHNGFAFGNFCDVCDALLTGAELAGGPLWGRTLCGPCTQEARDANPDTDPTQEAAA